MTLLAVFGLRDELRQGVAETLNSLRESRTFTRICSGDHEQTVRSLANELNMNVSEQSNHEILVESGEEFRK
jgi:P-type E1-E2 ATPase